MTSRRGCFQKSRPPLEEVPAVRGKGQDASQPRAYRALFEPLQEFRLVGHMRRGSDGCMVGAVEVNEKAEAFSSVALSVQS